MAVAVLPHNRIPLRRLAPYTPLREPKGVAKAMTIALGIQTPNGIVLCSDSQMTIPQYAKYPGRKVYTIRRSEWSIGLTFAGDPERMKSIWERMQSQLQSNQNLSEGVVRNCFEESQTAVRNSIINTYESIDVLCGFITQPGETQRLFSGRNGVVTDA